MNIEIYDIFINLRIGCEMKYDLIPNTEDS